MKKAVIFVRDTERSSSLEQEDKCRLFCARHDMEVVKVIREFQGIYDLGIDYVIVSDFSKLADNRMEIMLTIEALKEQGIGLITARYGMPEFKSREFTHNIIDKIKNDE